MDHRMPTRKILVILFWIAVWQGVSLLIRNDIIFVGPADVAGSLFQLLPSGDFWLSIARSFVKIVLGFLTAFLAGMAAGSLAFYSRFFEELLSPLISLVKSVPVASFVILALIWAGSEHLSSLIAFLVVFPIIYVSTLSGLQGTDPKLLEMADIFHVKLPRRIRCIYLPALTPYLSSSCRVAMGMAWKSGIAAEVIGVPAHTIGENLYMAKIYLATSDLFAWTIVIILVSALLEQLFLHLLNAAARRNQRSRRAL